MPYVITKVNGKDAKALKQIPLTKTEIARLKSADTCYTIVSVATHRVSHVGRACTRATPEDRWDGARRRRRYSFRDAAPPAAPSASTPPAQKPAPATTAGFLDKLFGRKKPKVHPMAKRIFMVKTKRGTYVPATVAAMGRARRRRRRR